MKPEVRGSKKRPAKGEEKLESGWEEEQARKKSIKATAHMPKPMKLTY